MNIDRYIRLKTRLLSRLVLDFEMSYSPVLSCPPHKNGFERLCRRISDSASFTAHLSRAATSSGFVGGQDVRMAVAIASPAALLPAAGLPLCRSSVGSFWHADNVVTVIA